MNPPLALFSTDIDSLPYNRLWADFASRLQGDNRLLHINFKDWPEGVVLWQIPDNRGFMQDQVYCLLPWQLEGYQRINAGLRLELLCVSDNVQLPLSALLGLAANVWIDTNGRDILQNFEARSTHYQGFVTHAKRLGSDGGFTIYQLIVEDWLNILRQRVNSRVFTELNILDMTLRVLADHRQNPALGPRLHIDTQRLVRSYAARGFVMQYNQSDFDFLTQRWAAEGISWFMQGNTLVLIDEPAGFAQLEGTHPIRFHRAHATETTDTIIAFGSSRQLTPGWLHNQSWDYKNAEMTHYRRDVGHTDQTSAAAAQDSDSHEKMASPAQLLNSSLEHHEHHTARWSLFSDTSNHDIASMPPDLASLQAQNMYAQAQWFEGKSTVRDMQAGCWFEMHYTDDGLSDADGLLPNETKDGAFRNASKMLDNPPQYLITGVDLYAQNNFMVSEQATPGFLKFLSTVGSSGIAAGIWKNSEKGSFYRNSFQALRRYTPLGSWQGLPQGLWLASQPMLGSNLHDPLTARVVGPAGEAIYTDALGRVKVRFMFVRPQDYKQAASAGTIPLADECSAWVRVAHSWASAGYGHVWIPRVGDEVLVQFMGGDSDKPIVTGCIYNGKCDPAHFSHRATLPGDKAISGIKSQMLPDHDSHRQNTPGLTHTSTGYLPAHACNELLMDDTHQELRARLACDYGHSALNQGYLIHARSYGHGLPRGAGIELRTDLWGSVRAGRGLLLSTYKRSEAQKDQLSCEELIAQINDHQRLDTVLSTVASHHGAPNHKNALQASGHQINILSATAQQNGHVQGPAVAAYQEPVLALSSPAGILAATPQSVHIAAGGPIHLSSAQATHMISQTDWITSAGGRASLFAQQGPIQLIAAQGPVKVQAQSQGISVNALENVSMTSTHGHISIVAEKSITLHCGGAVIRLHDGHIDIHAPGGVSVRSQRHTLSGPVKETWPLPEMASSLPGQYSQKLYVINPVDGQLLGPSTMISFKNGIQTTKQILPQGMSTRVIENSSSASNILMGESSRWRVSYATTLAVDTPPNE